MLDHSHPQDQQGGPDIAPLHFFAGTLLFAALAPLVMGSTGNASTVLVFAIAAAAANLLLGYAGLLSFAQGTFFGVGSYVTGMLLLRWPGLGLSVVLAALLAGGLTALVIGLLCIRQRGVYFVMITLAMAQLGYFAALSFPDWTGGENGLVAIPRPKIAFGGLQLSMEVPLQRYLVIAAMFVAALMLLHRIVHSPFGKVLDALRENEVRVVTLGLDAARIKILAFCLSGAITAVAGALFALHIGSAPVSNIDLLTSESILIMAILGGRRSLLGAALGALALTLMSELISPLWPRWQLIVGLVLIATVLFAPDGLGGALASARQRWNERKRAAAPALPKEAA